MNCIELCMNIYNNIIIQKVVKNESWLPTIYSNIKSNIFINLIYD